PQDAFQIQDGELYESLATVAAPAGGLESAATAGLGQLAVEFHASLAAENYYADAGWNEILNGYRQRIPNTTFLFPTGALGCVAHLLDLSGAGLMLLSGD